MGVKIDITQKRGTNVLHIWDENARIVREVSVMPIETQRGMLICCV